MEEFINITINTKTRLLKKRVLGWYAWRGSNPQHRRRRSTFYPVRLQAYFIKLFNFYSLRTKRSKEKFYKLLSTTFYRFKRENCLFGWVFRPCINATTTYCISSKYSQSISCILLWITKNRRRPRFYPVRLQAYLLNCFSFSLIAKLRIGRFFSIFDIFS